MAIASTFWRIVEKKKVCQKCAMLLNTYHFSKDNHFEDGIGFVCNRCNIQITNKFLNQKNMLDLILVIILLAWLGGFTLHIAGGLIHILLVVALVVLIIRLIKSV